MSSRNESSPEERHGAPRVSFFTLGCRLNQHDTAAMRSGLEEAGWRAAGNAEDAELLVVNTCTVTARADQEARQLIRRLSRERPSARVVVTGCYAQRAPEEIRALPGVALVLGTAERDRIAAWLPPSPPVAPGGLGPDRESSAAVAVGPARVRRPTAALGAPAATAPLSFGRSRALLKVQDGCDSFCSYCIVPYVRGRSRSVPREQVAAQARRLLEAGFSEIVLTGADLGSYGKDLEGKPLLAPLIRDLLALGAGHRIRISSIEPNKVPDDLLDLIGAEPRLCRHLHLPLQSGSPAVLRAMRRGYGPREYAEVVERAARRGPVAIGADVIVGHPGEGEAEFEESVRFLESLPFSYLHVFRYSPRPGTRAAGGGEARADASEARRRSERLRALGEARRREFARTLVGRIVPCVLERHGREGNPPLAMSDLYEPIRIGDGAPAAGLFDVLVERAAGDGILEGASSG